jgi:catechol 2,3-dioxygenase-like lactoylglutathione lyase family enzyme
MANIKLDHCVIHISNWKPSNIFYCDVLGAELVAVGDGWAYRFGETQLNVHVGGEDAYPLAKLPVMPGGSDLCFIWPGPISQAIRHLEKHEVRVEVGPVQRFGARGYGTSVYFRDPDGSLIEFISYHSE